MGLNPAAGADQSLVQLAFGTKDDFIKTLRGRVDAHFAGRKCRGDVRLYRKGLIIALWFFASYVLLLTVRVPALQILLCISYAFAAGAVGFNIFHDAGGLEAGARGEPRGAFVGEDRRQLHGIASRRTGVVDQPAQHRCPQSLSLPGIGQAEAEERRGLVKFPEEEITHDLPAGAEHVRPVVAAPVTLHRAGERGIVVGVGQEDGAGGGGEPGVETLKRRPVRCRDAGKGQGGAVAGQ